VPGGVGVLRDRGLFVAQPRSGDVRVEARRLDEAGEELLLLGADRKARACGERGYGSSLVRVSSDFWRQAWAVVFFVVGGLAVHEWLPPWYLAFWLFFFVMGFVFVTDCMPSSPWPFRRRARRREP
jgi:hypothetical protein